MARGRMISKSITKSKQVHALEDDTSRLAFTWAIALLDTNGVMHADPAIMRSEIFPRRDDVTNVDMLRMRDTWAEHGLVTVFEAEGDEWLHFPGFEKHQTGIRKDREAPSGNAEPPMPEDVRKVSGSPPESVRPKLREVNLREEEGERAGAREEQEPDQPPPLQTTNLPAIPKKSVTLYHRFEGKYGMFMPSRDQQLTAIADLLAWAERSLASSNGDGPQVSPEQFVEVLMESLADLKDSDDSKKGFWRDMPFLPHRLWQHRDQVLEHARTAFQEHKKDLEYENLRAEFMGETR